jgi:hypothetical protein
MRESVALPGPKASQAGFGVPRLRGPEPIDTKGRNFFNWKEISKTENFFD